MLLILVPEHAAKNWLSFDFDDIRLLTAFFAKNSRLSTLFIASLNSRSELWKLCESIGYQMQLRPISFLIYRSANLGVIKWSVEQGAISFHKTGHKTRFLLCLQQSPKFFHLCEKIYTRALKKKFPCLINQKSKLYGRNNKRNTKSESKQSAKNAGYC